MFSNRLMSKLVKKYIKASEEDDDDTSFQTVDNFKRDSVNEGEGPLKTNEDRIYSRLSKVNESNVSIGLTGTMFSELNILKNLGYEPWLKIEKFRSDALEKIKTGDKSYIDDLIGMYNVLVKDININSIDGRTDFINWFVKAARDPKRGYELQGMANYPGALHMWNKLCSFLDKHIASILSDVQHKDLPRRKDGRIVGTYKRKEDRPSFSANAVKPKIGNFFTDLGMPLSKFVDDVRFNILYAEIEEKEPGLIPLLANSVNRYTRIQQYTFEKSLSPKYTIDKSSRDAFIIEYKKTNEYKKLSQIATELLKTIEEKKDEYKKDIVSSSTGGAVTSINLDDPAIWVYLDLDHQLSFELQNSFQYFNKGKIRPQVKVAFEVLFNKDKSLYEKFIKGMRSVVNLAHTGSLSESEKQNFRIEKMKQFKASSVYQSAVSIIFSKISPESNGKVSDADLKVLRINLQIKQTKKLLEEKVEKKKEIKKDLNDIFNLPQGKEELLESQLKLVDSEIAVLENRLVLLAQEKLEAEKSLELQ